MNRILHAACQKLMFRRDTVMVKCSYCLRTVTISTLFFFLLGKGLEISVCAKLTEKEGSHHCESSYNSWVCFFGKFLGYFSLNGTVPSFCFGLIFSTSASFFSSYTRSIMLCLFFLVSICNQYFLWSLSPASAPPHMAKTCRFFTP